MRDFVRPGYFDLVINMFTSFGYFKDQEDNLRVLRSIKESLKSDGKLLMEMVSKEAMLRNYKDSIVSQQDEQIHIERYNFEDGMARMKNKWILRKAGSYKVCTLEHHICSGQELKVILQMCGFRNISLYGSLDPTPYDLNAKRLVVFAS